MMAGTRRSSGVVPFVLPAPAIARETASGWRQWRLARHDFVAAPQVALASYRRMSARHRMLHDLHRAATHANMRIQETPMSAAVSRIMWARVQTNALKRTPVT